MKTFYKVELYRYRNDWYELSYHPETETLLIHYFSTLKKAKAFCERCAEALDMTENGLGSRWERTFEDPFGDGPYADFEFDGHRWSFYDESIYLYYEEMKMDEC